VTWAVAVPAGRVGVASVLREESSVRVVVDYDLCQSNALCMGILPEVFEVRDDGFLYVLDEHPDASLRPKLEEAVRTCPTQAISLVDD